MLKLKNNFEIKDLEKFGFTSFKVNRNQTNYYRICAHARKGVGDMVLVDSVSREVALVRYHLHLDKVHAYPCMKMRDNTQAEEIVFELAVLSANAETQAFIYQE